MKWFTNMYVTFNLTNVQTSKTTLVKYTSKISFHTTVKFKLAPFDLHERLRYCYINSDKQNVQQEGTWALDCSPESFSTGNEVNHKI